MQQRDEKVKGMILVGWLERDKLRLDILSVKKEAKLSAREILIRSRGR